MFSVNLETKKYNIYINYTMPAKLNMVISNGNIMPPQIRSVSNPNNLAVTPKSSGALNNSMITRIHNVRPGCGSCGRK